ncbi:E3 ubiquitin-protein ligase DTX4-like isoform X2 [Artemia franciscana]|uniref:E3 ubiquitin-protein ligase DTX4-like isoform X2 n=1 Tax=Artemia franciscana TaxID=6661 RepID=UPI0032DAF0AA
MAGAQPGSSSNQYVVVWEWYHDSFGWRPYSPYVSQSLERAHSKKLKKLFLGDTEPSLSNYFVLFDRMEQICSKSDKAHQVRRIFYPQTSPAGCGRVWEWCDNAGWKSYNMEVQYVIDDAYHNTASSQLDLSKCFPQLPYIIDFEKDKQIRKETKYERKIRCANIASYPMTKPTDQDVIITLADIKSSKTKRFMGKITSLVKSISVPNSPKKGNQSNTAQSRQPLPGPQDLSQVPGPSGRRVRRPSSDTISTYLSKDSSGVDSNENLVDLDTSKDQTMSTRSAQNKRLAAPDTKNDILRTSSYVVEPPDADCAICYCPLAEKGGYTRQKDCPVELSQCGHVFHLCCLEQMAHDQINQTGIRCPSCKELYGVYSGNMPHGSKCGIGIGHTKCQYLCCIHSLDFVLFLCLFIDLPIYFCLFILSISNSSIC